MTWPCVWVYPHTSRSPEDSLWKIRTAGKPRHWPLDMETEQLGMFQPFVSPPSNKHWWILSALSVYGSIMLTVNSRLVHLLAVLIPLTPPFWFACSVFVMLKWQIFLVKRYVFICIRGEADVWTKSNVRIRHRFSRFFRGHVKWKQQAVVTHTYFFF